MLSAVMVTSENILWFQRLRTAFVISLSAFGNVISCPTISPAMAISLLTSCSSLMPSMFTPPSVYTVGSVEYARVGLAFVLLLCASELTVTASNRNICKRLLFMYA